MTVTPNKSDLKVALMQPTFLPWLGYFGLIHDSNVFVFLDDFQFVRQSYGHRNSLLINNQKSLITLPVSRETSHKENYLQTHPAITPKFIKKTLRSIEQNYNFSPWQEPVLSFLKTMFENKNQSLADLNISFIMWACNFCGIDSDFKRSSQMNEKIEGLRSEKVLRILDYYQAQTYLSAQGAFDYMCEDGVFPVSTVAIQFQNFEPVDYPQNKQDNFISYLSILDAILQIGPDETRQNILKASNRYKSWDEMQTEREQVT